MMDRSFWETARRGWVKEAPPKIVDVYTGLGGEIDSTLLADPWELSEDDKQVVATQPTKPRRPSLDMNAFEVALNAQTMDGYIQAGKLLQACELPEDMDLQFQDLLARMETLREVINIFALIYSPDMDQFYDYYFPETMRMTATYLDYLGIDFDEEFIRDLELQVIDTVQKLILAVKEKTAEIFKFANIELKAQAKALEAMMSQGGFVDPEYKL